MFAIQAYTAMLCQGLKRERIFEVDLLEYGGNLVVTIGTPAQHLEGQVDLCIGRDG
jgi:hypothetical protein